MSEALNRARAARGPPRSTSKREQQEDGAHDGALRSTTGEIFTTTSASGNDKNE